MLTTVNLPICSIIGSAAFYNCTSLTTIDLPACTVVSNSAFNGCRSLTTINLPICSTIGSAVFYNCSSLTTIDLPACTTIGNSAFRSCYKLLSLYLRASTVCTLSNSSAFMSTPIARYTNYTGGVYGSIFVPASLVDAYKTATNWTYFKSRITAIPE